MRRRILTALLLLVLLLMPAAAHAADDRENEQALYYGTIGKRMTVYRWGDADSTHLGTIEAGRVVDVYNKGRTWTRIDFDGRQGYVLTKFIERVQRKDPFQGPMPGTSKHVAVGYVLKDISFRPEGYKYPVKVSEGSWLSIERI